MKSEKRKHKRKQKKARFKALKDKLIQRQKFNKEAFIEDLSDAYIEALLNCPPGYEASLILGIPGISPLEAEKLSARLTRGVNEATAEVIKEWMLN